MPRAFLIVIDSVGIGGAPDADQFFNGTLSDTGANTVGHIARAVDLALPTLDALCLLYTSPSPRDKRQSRMPSSA